jgi:antitoxin (DNA-binding transcriptional repressor) of toxin-antitoxin stability system
MKTIEVDELKERIDEILRVVQEQGETFEIIDHGKTIARIVPADEAQTSTKRDLTPFWEEMERVATEIGSYLSGPVDVNDIMRDIRRDL